MANPFDRIPAPLVGDPYDPEPDREKVRGRLTLATTLVFGLVVVLFLSGSFFGSEDHWNRIKDAMQSVLPAVASVLGTVIGFYFGSQKRKTQRIRQSDPLSMGLDAHAH